MTKEKPKILVAAKKKEYADQIDKLFGDKAELKRLSSTSAIEEQFRKTTYDVLVLTSAIARQNRKKTIQTLDTIANKCPITQIILIAEPDDIDFAMSALLVGTYHYAKMPMPDRELKLLIETALADRPQFGTNLLLNVHGGVGDFDAIIGNSAPMQKVYKQIQRAAATDIHILILGETGTGKDLVASTIHRLSKRSDGPYIPVNLGSLPMELVSSELFGHEKGAFTGASGRRIGVFEQGNDGTVFLDEIDNTDEKVKVSLLRLIEQKYFTRIGGRRQVKSDARIIAASNANLEEMIENNKFRKDLFYRLDTFRINLPPLRERHGDIPVLAENFIARYSKSFERPITDISKDFIARLEEYDWPGNIRELKNVIQKSVLLCDGRVLKAKHLPTNIRGDRKSKPSVKFEIGTPLGEIEKEMIQQALAVVNNNRSKAAELLGISRRAIYNKLNKYNID